VYYPETQLSEAAKVLAAYSPDWVINFAAETHVDRSIDNAAPFIDSNVVQLQQFLDDFKAYARGRDVRFLQVGTDEVYGDRDGLEPADESTAIQASSPYAASKAAADLLVQAYGRTYGMPWLITRCGNNFGPRQMPEKLIPLMISKAMASETLPVYGDGQQLREWIFVEEHCEALLTLLESGGSGHVFNIGSGQPLTNLEVVKAIEEEVRPGQPSLAKHVQDRPGHDREYAMDVGKIYRLTGWQDQTDFFDALHYTINWYRRNPEWVGAMAERGYTTRRVGLTTRSPE
jgi:dTDP-glucose 4,6-dehydratase